MNRDSWFHWLCPTRIQNLILLKFILRLLKKYFSYLRRTPIFFWKRLYQSQWLSFNKLNLWWVHILIEWDLLTELLIEEFLLERIHFDITHCEEGWNSLTFLSKTDIKEKFCPLIHFTFNFQFWIKLSEDSIANGESKTNPWRVQILSWRDFWENLK